MRQDYLGMEYEYIRAHPEVDWREHEVFFVFRDRQAQLGLVEVGGHRPIDWSKFEQIKGLTNGCCCGKEGCP